MTANWHDENVHVLLFGVPPQTYWLLIELPTFDRKTAIARLKNVLIYGSVSFPNGWSHPGTIYLLQMNIFVSSLLLNVPLTQLIDPCMSHSVFNS